MGLFSFLIQRREKMIITINKDDLILLGFTEGTSKQIIRKGKKLLVERDFVVYKNKRIGTIPATIVSELLGIEIQDSKLTKG